MTEYIEQTSRATGRRFKTLRDIVSTEMDKSETIRLVRF